MDRINLSKYFALEICIAALIAVMNTIHQENIASIFFYTSIILVFFYTLVYSRVIVSQRSVFLYILCIVNVLLNYMTEGGAMSFDYFKKVIMFISFMCFLEAASSDSVFFSQKSKKIILLIPTLLGTYMVFSYYFLGNTETLAGAVSLGFSNSNFAGMWLLHCFLYTLLYVINDRNTNILKLVFVPVLFFEFQLILATSARSCLASLLFFVVVTSLGILQRRMNKVVAFVVSVFPIVFFIFYMYFVNTIWFTNTFQFAVSVGKELGSRELVWSFALDKFMQHPFIGNYSGISNGTGAAQLHNTHIDMLSSYGIIPSVIFISKIYNTIKEKSLKSGRFYTYVALCSFCTIIVSGSFESAMVSGAMGMNLLTVGLLVLATDDFEPLIAE